jgi:leucyl-tRNA synthetase
MIPHIAEELWTILGEKPSIFDQPFPVADEKHLARATVEIAVQINSKIVGRINVPSNATQSAVEKLCTEYTADKTVKKAIYIAGRIINFIA